MLNNTMNGNNKLKVLSLYKQILKLGHDWKNLTETQKSNSFNKKVYEKQAVYREQSFLDNSKPIEELENESKYIIEEAKRQFRENKNLINEDIIEDKIKQAENRYVLAKHYNIPYDRPFHKQQDQKPYENDLSEEDREF
ncbi:hypothetical protein ABK040_000287 [Willaertia magna]